MKYFLLLLIASVMFVLYSCHEGVVNDIEGDQQLEQTADALVGEKHQKEIKRTRTCKRIASAKVKATARQMEIEVLLSNSDFVNHIYLVSPGSPTFLATDDDTGTIVSLPDVRKNQELVFEIRVDGGSPVWKTGPGSRNSDGRRHAVVEKCGASYTVNFEDIDASGWGTADEPNFVDAVFEVRPR